MVKAKKSYEMVACPCCHGQGQGREIGRPHWYCENCDGAGKVSRYPKHSKPGEVRYEPLLDKG